MDKGWLGVLLSGTGKGMAQYDAAIAKQKEMDWKQKQAELEWERKLNFQKLQNEAAAKRAQEQREWQEKQKEDDRAYKEKWRDDERTYQEGQTDKDIDNEIKKRKKLSEYNLQEREALAERSKEQEWYKNADPEKKAMYDIYFETGDMNLAKASVAQGKKQGLTPNQMVEYYQDATKNAINAYDKMNPDQREALDKVAKQEGKTSIEVLAERNRAIIANDILSDKTGKTTPKGTGSSATIPQSKINETSEKILSSPKAAREFAEKMPNNKAMQYVYNNLPEESKREVDAYLYAEEDIVGDDYGLSATPNPPYTGTKNRNVGGGENVEELNSLVDKLISNKAKNTRSKRRGR